MKQTSGKSAEALMLAVVDGALVGVVFIVPLLLGGRHPLGRLLLMSLAMAMALAWVGYLLCSGAPRWRPNWAMPIMAAAAALTLLQGTPLSSTILHWLAPGNAELLPLWNAPASSGAGLGVWQYLSMTPAETRAGFAIFTAYVLVFTTLSQRLASIEDVERVLRWCALSAIGMAVFGLIQYFGSNGNYFWFYQHFQCTTADVVKGSFTNRNHFTQFLALGIGPIIWWLQQELHSKKTGRSAPYLLSLALGIVLFAGLLSLSRGGAIAMVVAVTVVTLVCYQSGSLGKRFIGVMAVAALLIGVSLAIFGYERVSKRIDTLSSGSFDEIDGSVGRRSIWSATLTSISHHLISGSGVGSFAEVYPVHAGEGFVENYEFSHAECGYLQVALETGLPGFLLLLCGIGICAGWCFRGLTRGVPKRLQLCAGAIAAGLAANVAHSVVDFVWYIPACAVMVAVLAACILRTGQLADATRHASPSRPLSKFAAAVTGAMVVLTGILILETSVKPARAALRWNHYLLAVDVLERESVQKQSGEEPVVPRGHPRQLEDEERLIADLQQVVAFQPSHARAHMALVEAYLRLFDRMQMNSINPMSLMNIRDAVVQSQFPTQEAMADWLSRAIGEHWRYLALALHHTRKCLALCPLQGRSYVYLAELCFLDPELRLPTSAYIEQALRVRPCDGTVLYGAATEAFLAGDTEKWLQFIKQAFHGSRRHQKQLIEDLIAHTSTENIPTMIDFIVRELQPDLSGIRLLHGACKNRCTSETLKPLVLYWAQFAECEAVQNHGTPSLNGWLEASRLYLSLGNDPKGLECAQRAKRCDPSNYSAHYHLALCQLKQGLFDDAEANLLWCRGRKPNDRNLEAKLREVLKGRLDAQLRSTAEKERSIDRATL